MHPVVRIPLLLSHFHKRLLFTADWNGSFNSEITPAGPSVNMYFISVSKNR